MLRILVLSLALLASVTTAQKNYQEACDHVTAHCDSDKGLYCNAETSICECVPGQVFDNKYNYVMSWDEEEKTCAAARGSICLGTADAEAPVSVKCITGLTCVQSEEHRESIGICSGALSVFGTSSSVIAAFVVGLLALVKFQ